mmetsp:Transcript_5945/g.22569  ORF Transcript_5945/g.22569 Transcript_5945/m.22569 type:complete len:532 (-) Transcript_5945:423-2018(-)
MSHEFLASKDSLLRRGQKYNSHIKSIEKLDNAHQQLFNAMAEPRKRAYNLVSEAIIFRAGQTRIEHENDAQILDIPEQLKNCTFIRIIKQRSKHWGKMGHHLKGNLYVEPEEALLLFERGLLRLWVYEGEQWRREVGEYLVEEECKIARDLVERHFMEKEQKRNQVMDRPQPEGNEDPSFGLSRIDSLIRNEADQKLFDKMLAERIDSIDIQHLKAACRPLFSLQDGFACITCDIEPLTQKPLLDINHYLVYRYLRQTGYSVLRHCIDNYEMAHSSDALQKQQEMRIKKLTRINMRRRETFASAVDQEGARDAVNSLLVDSNVWDIEKIEDEDNSRLDRGFWDNSVVHRLSSLKRNPKNEQEEEENQKMQDSFAQDAILLRHLERDEDPSSLVPELEEYNEAVDLPSSLIGHSELAQLPDNTIISQQLLRDTLQIIKTDSFEDQESFDIPPQWEIVFDVWRSEQKSVKRKDTRPVPYCAVVITSFESQFPSVEVIHEWERQCGTVPVHVATLQKGSISFSNMSSVEIPDVV